MRKSILTNLAIMALTVALVAGAFASFQRKRSSFERIDFTFTRRNGVVVVKTVDADSGAQQAGLRPGDVVIGVAGQSVFTPDELTQAIQKRGGQTFEIVVQRDGKPVPLQVTATTVKEKSPSGQDVEIGRIGDLLDHDLSDFLAASPVGVAATNQERT